MLFLPSVYRGTLGRAGWRKKRKKRAQRYSRGENRSLTVFVSIQLSSIRSMLDTQAYNEASVDIAPIPGKVILQRDKSQIRSMRCWKPFTICTMQGRHVVVRSYVAERIRSVMLSTFSSREDELLGLIAFSETLDNSFATRMKVSRRYCMNSREKYIPARSPEDSVIDTRTLCRK